MNFEARADIDKNRIYLTLDGFFTDAQVKEAVAKTLEEVDKLQSGFDIISDISRFKPATPEGAREIAQTQAYAIEKGVKRIVRVVGESVIGQMQMERLGRETHLEGDLVTSIQEAEKLLDAE